MNWALHVRGKAKKNLGRMPRKEQERVNEALLELTANPYSGDLVKLGGEDNLWRRRIGAYRIKFQIRNNERIIYIYEIGLRTSKTY